jgi:uncharacterized protein YkwD
MRRVASRSLTIEQLESRRLLAFNPTAHEQEMLQLFNRFRTDPQGEFNRMFSSASPLRARDSSLQAELDLHNVNGNMLRNEWAALNPAEPLVWNEALYQFASAHNSKMISQNNAFHSSTAERQQAISAAGIQFQLEGELVSLRASNPVQGYAVYAVNWGTNANTGNSKGGMQDPRGHRTLLINAAFDQIGHRVTNTNASFLKPTVNTAVLVDTLNAPTYVTGAVFEDKNSSKWYDAGEGRSNVTLRFEKTTGEVFTTKTLSAGGYQIILPAGIYKVRATGGGMKHAVVQKITVDNTSLWRNFIYDPNGPAPDAHEPNNDRVTATRLSGRSPELSNLSLHTSSDVDFFRFVPEGTAMATYEIEFDRTKGHIDIELQDSSGKVLAQSSGQSNKKTVVYQADAGKVYFLKVFGQANPSYSLKIDGPEAITPDAYEPNDSLQSAVNLNGASPNINQLSLHSNHDIDFYKYTALANGSAEFNLEFLHSQGNIDMQLLDSTGKVLATSASMTNGEQIIRNVLRNTVYYVKVYGGPNRNYLLKIKGPELRPPVATDDQGSASSDSRVTNINILSNDLDPDGDASTLVPKLGNNAPAAFVLNADFSLTYTAPIGFHGMHRATYTITNQDGLVSKPATIEIFVINYQHQTPWRHPVRHNDVNDDGRVTAIDALMVINELNSRRSRNLPTSGNPVIRGFVDTNGDGRVTANDALRIVNELNLNASGEGEMAETRANISRKNLAQYDVAIAQMVHEWTDSWNQRRRR